MKKIPTLFVKQYDENGKYIGVSDEVTPGMGWVLEGKGKATVKYDGTCIALLHGAYYKRYDAKNGKTPPEGSIPCVASPDPETGHWPHWVKIDPDNPADKWITAAIKDENGDGDPFLEFLEALSEIYLYDFTMEVVGRHFNGNPYKLRYDHIAIHGMDVCEVERSYEGIRRFLEDNPEMEGLVFWAHGRPQCKIRRKDFGMEWPI